MNKKAIRMIGGISVLVVLFFSLILTVTFSQQISAGKANQYNSGNLTCEPLTDTVAWTAIAKKGGSDYTYYNWSMDTDCLGTKSCDIAKIENYIRYLNVGDSVAATEGHGYVQMANKTESPVSVADSKDPVEWSGKRYSARLNSTDSVPHDGGYELRWECAQGSSPNTCDLLGQGFDNYTKNYSVHVFGHSAGATLNTLVITDVFSVKYDWCWIPIIRDIDISADSGTYEDTFTFTVNVTNPSANTTVQLWIRKIGGSWAQEGINKSCANCSGVQSPYDGLLSWDVTFAEADIGNWEFKFTATDDAGYSVDANSSSITNECLDDGNDCKFGITNIEVASGVPVLVNETVNAVESGAVDGWGSNWTFSVNVSNPADATSDINLTLQLDTGSGFVDKESQTCSGPCQSSTKFTFYIDDLSCSDRSSAQYRFNATNENGTTFATQSFTIEKDDVVLQYFSGNNTIVNRSGDQTRLLILRIYDSDNETYVGAGINASFTVTIDGSTQGAEVENSTNSTGHILYYFNPTCSPTKYAVGDQNWKASTSDETCYKDVSSEIFNVSILGDISLIFNEPTSDNQTQEDTVSFLGSTWDDCGDSLVSTVIYNANTTGDGMICNNTSTVGANAFKCYYDTDISALEGWYNTTMYSNASKHHNNQTNGTGNPGLFYLLPKYKLENPLGVPASAGWGSSNWNFSVVASSGNINEVMNISFYLGQSVNPNECTSPTCINQTVTSCNNCIDTQKSWFRNFTSSNQGQWFYQFKMDDPDDTSTSGTTNYVTVTKDATNVSYGGSGNDTTVIYLTQSQNLSVKVFDIDKDSFNVTVPSATVTFKLLDSGYGGGEKIIGSNVTNSSGYADFFFNMTVCDYITGAQKWVGEINSSESNYNESISENFTITLDTTGCSASIAVSDILIPDETFLYTNFSVNATVSAFISTATNVNMTLNIPAGWTVYNQKQSLGSVVPGASRKVSWIVNPTTYGNFNVSVFANSSNAGNDTEYSATFTSYKELAEISTIESLPAILTSNEEKIFSWNCNASNYRIGKLKPSWNSTGTTVKIETYTGLIWRDILHSKYINTSYAIETPEIAILSEQIFTNETGFCTVRITNIGTDDINISELTLENYYEEDVRIQDIIAKVGAFELTGIETTEKLINFTVKVYNSLDSAKSLTVTLNVTNSSGVVNSSINSSVNIGANSEVDVYFLNVNTSTWNSGEYELEAYLSGDETDSRVENLTFEDVEVYGKLYDYMCNGTVEEYTATVYHPFGDSVDYNVSMEVPSGWTVSSDQWINATSAGNYSVTFNVTSGQTNMLTNINATIKYTYPTAKDKKAQEETENNNSIAILEIVRESPIIIGGDKVFDAQLSIHNKGCATTTSATTIKETVSTGWTPANPSSLGDISLTSAETDLINNIITWELGTIGVNKYAVLTYQIKTPTSSAQSGDLRYNVTWEDKNLLEESNFDVQTFNYTDEAHLQFDIEAIQQDDYPWEETRSAQLNYNYNYSLEVKNIGDINAAGWNVTLEVQADCDVNQVYNDGSETGGIITWSLAETIPYGVQYLNFTTNCSEEGKHTLIAKGIKDTRTTEDFTNSTSIGCSTSSCSTSESFAFSQPNNPRYEKLANVDFYISYNWTDYSMTIGEGYVNFTDDYGEEYIVWQNYSFANTDGEGWHNYTIDTSEQDNFVDATRTINVRSYVDGIGDKDGSVTVENISYTWNTGKLFEEEENLFTKVKVYDYDSLLQSSKLIINGDDSEIVGGWGEEFNFTVEAGDRFDRNVTVYLWHKKGAADYELVDSQICESCSLYTQINFTHDYNGDDISTWVFKFNATNPDGSSSLAGFTYTVEKDDIDTSYINPTNEISINRSDSTIFSVKVYDSDNQTYPDGVAEASGKIYVSTYTDLGTFETSPNTINADVGFLNRTIDNSEWCNTAAFVLGKHAWYGGTEGHSDVKNNLTKDYVGYRNFTLVGSLANVIELPDGTANFTRGSSISFDGNVKDDCNVDMTGTSTIIYLMENGAFSANCTAGPGGDCEISTDSTFPVGYYNITMSSNKSGHNDGILFNESLFFLRSVPLLESGDVDVRNDGWGVQRLFTVNVSDNTGDNVTVQLWQYLGSEWEFVEEKNCTSCDDTELNFTVNYTCANKGSGKKFKFNATDTEGNSDETTILEAGDYIGDDNTFVIDEDNVQVEYISGNETNATLEVPAGFVVRVYDSDKGTYDLTETATITFNATKTGRGTTQYNIGTNTTNSTGYVTFSFTPDQTYDVAKQDWTGYTETQSCYEFNTTLIYNVTTLVNALQLVNETVSPMSDGWGIEKTFNITVRDTNNEANVSLYRASSLASPNWIYMSSQNYTNVANWEILNFTQTFNPGLIGTWYYKFNASNDVGNVNSTATTAFNNFTLENENVLLEYIAGHDETANRSGNQTTLLSFRVKDENGTYLGNFSMKFSVQSDGSNYFTDTYFVVNTNSTGHANFDFNATCLGEVSGAPKFLVGSQNWKITVNDSELGEYQQNDSSIFLARNLSVQGDIGLEFNNPDGVDDYVQEQTITFLGATTDDCGDALVTTVVYYANSSEDNMTCDSTSQIGANAFQCIYQTYLNKTRGDYNTTMNANKADHYSNSTSKTDSPGLFYLEPKKKLDSPTSVPTADGWGSLNWNFSIVASSGDPDNNLTVGLYMGQTINPTSECESSVCFNQTTKTCNNEEDKSISWLRNFTSSDIGEWYYQFKLDDSGPTATSGTDYSVVVRKDETNITYGGAGNDSSVAIDGSSQNLTVRVFDLDRDTYNVSNPGATVVFKLLHDFYDDDEKIIGTATTNQSGYAILNFSFTECSGWQEGAQHWKAEINSSEPNYNTSISDLNYTIELIKSGCEASVDVASILVPSEVFQNRNFSVNATVTAWQENSLNVFIISNTSGADYGWIFYNQTQNLGTVTQGSYDPVTWIANPITTGLSYMINVFANSSNAGNDSMDSSSFKVYKEFADTVTADSLPIIIDPANESIVSWTCNISDYRTSDVTLSLNATSTIRVYSYDGLEWRDILHSRWVNTSNGINSINIPIIQNQLNANGTSSCAIKIENIGSGTLNITNVSLAAYHFEDASVKDIVAKVGSVETTGMETSDLLLNVSVKIYNGLSSSKSVSVRLNVTNSTGDVVNSTINSSVTLAAYSETLVDFMNVPTSAWNEEDYSLTAYMIGDVVDNRSEDFIFKNVTLYTELYDYMCNGTLEEFDVTVYHPFNDSVDYNVSLEIPFGWVASADEWINATTAGNYTVVFNLTSNQTNSNPTINAKVSYNYPGAVSKERTASENVENNNSISILEIVREAPLITGKDTELNSRLVLYNKGCASASSINLVETVGTGWTAYASTIDGTSGGTSDIPDREVRFDTNDLGTIEIGGYKVLAYKVFSPSQNQAESTLRYNLSWGNKNIYEKTDFKINTSTYNTESRLSFEIRAVDSFRDRSAEPDEDQFYEFNVTNIGDYDIHNLTWNVTIKIPGVCEVSNHTGEFNAVSRNLLWNLGNLTIENTNSFFFNMNCSDEGSYILLARGINDTRVNTTTTEEVSSTIECSGVTCSDAVLYNFSKPANARYEKMIQADFLVNYNFTDYALSIGEGYLNFTDDNGVEYPLWQNNIFEDANGKYWVNYTVDNPEWDDFQDESRNVNVYSYVDGTSSTSFGNVSVSDVSHTWTTGKLFEEEEDLFVNIKPYVFTLSPPSLSLPEDGSSAYVDPVVLSWATPSIPDGYNLTYYVYGDTTDGSTYLGSVEVAQYFWWGLTTGDTYYWKIKAGIEGQNSSFSETWQFSLDLCTADADYAYALDYPMSYNASIDTITVWGSNGTDGSTAMGFNSSDPITFAEIYEFGRAVRGVCAVTNPAEGSYAVLSRLELGNTSSQLNATFVKTTGESIDFGKQLQINFNATFVSGLLSADGNPYAGSTLSFSGVDATDDDEGELYMLNNSYLELYDSILTHKTAKQNTNPFKFNINGAITAKRTSFENIWYLLLTDGDELDFEDVVFTNMGIGLYAKDSSTGFNTVYIRYIDEAGLYLENNVDLTVTILEIAESTDDIKLINYTGTANLLNSNLNWSNLNWTTGSFSGIINRRYGYDATATDSSGSAVANTTMIMLDVFGDVLFSLTTDANGEIDAQTITRSIYDYSNKEGVEQGPHRLLIKKYGKSFQTVAKEFAAATVETVQLATNIFVSGTEETTAALSNIEYNKPTKVSYGTEFNSSVTTSMTLQGTPIDQCQYSAIFANGSKLIEGAKGTGNYILNYETGVATFHQDMVGYNITPTYYYGGNLSITNGITIANAFTMGDLYDYMQYASAINNLSEELTTVDGITYSFCIDLVVGNSTEGGSIQDAGKTIEFEAGYDVSEGDGGAIIDLAGVGGSGTVGAIEISRKIIYEGEFQTAFISLSDSLGNPLTGRTLHVEVLYPNGTSWIDGETVMEEIENGLYDYGFQMPLGHKPYGAYAIHITATGISQVRTFEYVPDSIINVRGYLDTDEYLDWSVAYIKKNDHQVNLLGAVQNQYGYAINLSKYFLWDNNYFLMIDSKLKQNWDSLELYEEESTSLIDEVISTDVSNWTFSGDVINLSATEESYIGDYALNMLLNYSTGIGTISRNFSSVDVSDSDNHLHLPKIYINFPDITNITNISIKLKTNESNYFVLNKNLVEWKIWKEGWNSLHYPDVAERTSVGNPSVLNISGIEIIFYHNYTTPTNITLDHLQVDHYYLVPDSRRGTKNIADSYYLFWWDENEKYNLNANEERNFWLKINSSQYDNLVDWHEQHPTDTFITEQYNNMLDANFYWQQWLSEDKVLSYLQGNPGQNLFMMSDIGSSYSRSDTPRTNILTSDKLGNLVSASVNVSVNYPNGSILSSGIPTESQTGNYNYSFDIPVSAPYGDYSVLIESNYSGYNSIDTKIFSVVASSSGGLPLNVFSGVGSTYALGETVYVISTAIDSTGELINATVDISLYYANGSLLSSGEAIRTSEGRTKYNYSLSGSAPEGTYSVEINANYSGDESHESLAFMVTIGAGSSAQPYVNVGVTPDIIDINQSMSITASTYSSLGNLVNCDSGAVVSIRDIIRETYVVSDDAMTNFETGRYSYIWNPVNTSNYLVSAVCVISGDASIGEDVFSVTRGFSADLLDVGEVAVGDSYNSILRIYNNLGGLIDADTIPTITLIDPNSNSIVSNTVMTHESTGTYTYTFATTGYTAGNWETTANLTVDGTVHQISESWELESTYADVSNPAITDNTLPSITATTYISNNGTSGSDFEIVYCIVEAPENTCGGTDDVDIATKTEYFESEELRVVSLTDLEVPSVGDYYFRVQARPVSATETAWGLSSFTAISAETPPVVTPPSGGGSGGGSGFVIAPIEEDAKEETLEPKKELPLFENLGLRILPKYLTVYSGESVAVEIIFDLDQIMQNAKLKYFIENSNGNIMVSIQEIIDVTTNMKILREIDLPNNIEHGEYLFVAELEYEGIKYLGKYIFNIVSEEKKIDTSCCLGNVCWFNFILCWYWWVLILTVLVARVWKKWQEKRGDGSIGDSLGILEALSRRRRQIAYTHKRHKSMLLQKLVSKRQRASNQKEDLNKLINYVREEV